jgi:hypothetical protein
VACSAASGLPFGLWVMFVHTHTASDATAWAASFPFSGLLRRTINPFPFEITGAWVGAAAVTDYLGILAIWVAIAEAFVLLRARRGEPMALAGLGFVLLAAFLGKEDVWQQTYGFSRIFSPWFVLLAAAALQQNSKWMLLPWALSLPRIAVQAWVHVSGIVSGIITTVVTYFSYQGVGYFCFHPVDLFCFYQFGSFNNAEVFSCFLIYSPSQWCVNK